MTTVIFVHGTGVRKLRYDAAFKKIQAELSAIRPDVTARRCYWGDAYGAKLNWEGASIPLYDSTRGIEAVQDDHDTLILWALLYQDPFYELRTLALQRSETTEFVPGRISMGDTLELYLERLDLSAVLDGVCKDVDVSELFLEARDIVTRATVFQDALRVEPDAGVIARALVAQVIAECERRDLPSSIVTDASLRDQIVQRLRDALGPAERGLGGWAATQLYGLALRLGAMNHVQRRRGAIMDAAYPAAGDILLYQARGTGIREYTRETVLDAALTDSDVVLLAHSLGGIASFELLISGALPQVKLLITVGSQVPFLYEINALQTLRHDEPLPRNFPPWLNIYDLRDFLSYIAAGVFAGSVQDIPVDNRQTFPISHSAYWDNPATWKAIKAKLA